MSGKSILERAFELAREHHCRSLDDIRRKLVAESYSNVDAHLDGKMIKKQLREAMRQQDA
jgi:hypothetical protein